MNSHELAKYLFDNVVYDAYQFFINTLKTLHTAVYCKDVIISIISKMELENEGFQNHLFENLMSQSEKIKKVSVHSSDLPKYELSVCDVEINAPFLLDKLIKDFFQYIRNAFDCMSQAANAACLANNSINIERVDFSSIKSLFSRQPYSSEFPNIALWYSNIDSSDEFKYIQDFNNRTKHICDVYIKLSMAIVGENETSISPFYKHRTQYDKQDIKDYLTSVYDFVSDAYSKFMDAIKLEIAKQKYIENRFQTLAIYQQKFKDDNGFSIAYLETNSPAEELPEKIHILFVKEQDEEIIAKNCQIKEIYFKKAGTEHEYISKYISDEDCTDDTILQYRTYKKDTNNSESFPLLFSAMVNTNNKVFFHLNPFVKITSISDDDEFQARVALPF